MKFFAVFAIILVSFVAFDGVLSENPSTEENISDKVMASLFSNGTYNGVKGN